MSSSIATSVTSGPISFWNSLKLSGSMAPALVLMGVFSLRAAPAVFLAISSPAWRLAEIDLICLAEVFPMVSMILSSSSPSTSISSFLLAKVRASLKVVGACMRTTCLTSCLRPEIHRWARVLMLAGASSARWCSLRYRLAYF